MPCCLLTNCKKAVFLMKPTRRHEQVQGPRFIQDRKLLLTLLRFSHHRDFARVLQGMGAGWERRTEGPGASHSRESISPCVVLVIFFNTKHFFSCFRNKHEM